MKLKSLIMVVEDNIGILANLKMTLEFNNFKVITAKNGNNAIKILNGLQKLPDIIISDIMMPEMNGYDFFKKVAENPIWSNIPFIFLTARSTPDDIRLGKILGVDDYITKPFKEEDLLASIKGKINRNNKVKSIIKEISKTLTSLKIDLAPSITEEEKDEVSLSYFLWDEKVGPQLMSFYPMEMEIKLTIQSVGPQLFIATASIYGQENLNTAQGILLNIENIHRDGYIYFDSILDEDVRGGYRRFMLTVIAPKINYFESLKIRKIYKEISNIIKEGKDWDVKKYWKVISEILSTPMVQI